MMVVNYGWFRKNYSNRKLLCTLCCQCNVPCATIIHSVSYFFLSLEHRGVRDEPLSHPFTKLCYSYYSVVSLHAFSVSNHKI